MGGFLPFEPFQNGAELTVEHRVNLAAFGTGRQNDALNERAQRVGCLLPLLWMRQSFCKPLDLATINLRDVRMDIRYIGRGCSKSRADGIFLRFQFEQLIDERARSLAFRRERHQFLYRLQDPVEFSPVRAICGATLAIEAIGFLDAGANGFGSYFGTH
ncbi:MAG TPA: hypothetical protein VF509_13980 [Sphingobium sp.]